MSEIFHLKHVAFAYPAAEPVFRDLCLSVSAGERIAVLGVNGCGKSTLLKMLAGLIAPGQGRMEAFGKPVHLDRMKRKEAEEYHQKVGYVFQDSDVQLFCGSVREELAFGPLQKGEPAKQVMEQVQELSEELGIAKLLDKAPFHLSGGEKKKVAIASALILQPEVLILDEPTNNLDPRSQTWLLKVLRRLSGEGKTLIFATHALDLVPHIADRAVLFDEAHTICADRPVKEMLEDKELLRGVNLVDAHFHTHPWDFE
ncbi:energy-coupling factor ABC transporter ATP-binding protein [Eubacterium sp. F2]|uniref:energy-coupling factor ABC transporter ATP-binding protein n=1 Tax=Eubacterium sp. F2 TaxID=3381348 RepID=UPI0039082471